MSLRILRLAAIGGAAGAACLFAVAASRAQDAPPQQAGDVIAADDFSDAASGMFPNESPQPDRFQVGYTAGEYKIVSIDPNVDTDIDAVTKNAYTDLVINADVRLTGLTTLGSVAQVVLLGCRHSDENGSAYALEVTPLLGTFRIVKNSDSTPVELVPQQNTPAIHQGLGMNGLQLSCAGSTISASINGMQVASVQDSSYDSGTAFMGAGVYANFLPATVDARFSNLVLSRP
jgi:hypothetical protein